MDATERCSRTAASFSNCLMSADVRIDKVSSFSRFMVLHPNGLVLQMYCVLRVLDAMHRPYFRRCETCQLVSKGMIFRIRRSRSCRLDSGPYVVGAVVLELREYQTPGSAHRTDTAAQISSLSCHNYILPIAKVRGLAHPP